MATNKRTCNRIHWFGQLNAQAGSGSASPRATALVADGRREAQAQQIHRLQLFWAALLFAVVAWQSLSNTKSCQEDDLMCDQKSKIKWWIRKASEIIIHCVPDQLVTTCSPKFKFLTSHFSEVDDLLYEYWVKNMRRYSTPIYVQCDVSSPKFSLELTGFFPQHL